MINFCKIVLHHVELLVRRSLLIHPPSLMIVSPGVRGHKHGHVCDRTLHLNMVYNLQMINIEHVQRTVGTPYVVSIMAW